MYSNIIPTCSMCNFGITLKGGRSTSSGTVLSGCVSRTNAVC